MPAHRVTMRKTREILRLRWGLGLSGRATARSVRCSPSTVAECVRRATAAGLSWPLPPDLDDGKLEARLYPGAPMGKPSRPMPDMRHLHRELRRKGVTLELLWQEYREAHPDGYGYSRFCELYRQWRGGLDLVMRQEHIAGDRAFVDYAGVRVPIVDPRTGEVADASVFVMALGASSYTYAEVVAGEDLRSWIGAHVRAFRFFGGVPNVLVPDNLKSGVTKPSFYDPEINPTYHDLAEYHDTTVIPARPRHPRDKAKAESAVQQVERWVLAPLRDQTFFSIAEANRAVGERLEWLNRRALSKVDASRRDLYEQLDKPALKPLPVRPYEVPERKSNVGVNIDYHIEYDGHYYSVPCTLARKRVDVRATATTIEILYQGRRVASHQRSYRRGKHTTTPEHRPKTHREWGDWTPSRLIQWASTIGPATAETVRVVMDSKRHPEQGFRASLGIIRLGDRYGKDRLERACERARLLGAQSYGSVQSILKTGFDLRPPPDGDAQVSTPIDHDNVRGANYYQ